MWLNLSVTRPRIKWESAPINQEWEEGPSSTWFLIIKYVKNNQNKHLAQPWVSTGLDRSVQKVTVIPNLDKHQLPFGLWQKGCFWVRPVCPERCKLCLLYTKSTYWGEVCPAIAKACLSCLIIYWNSIWCCLQWQSRGSSGKPGHWDGICSLWEELGWDLSP